MASSRSVVQRMHELRERLVKASGHRKHWRSFSYCKKRLGDRGWFRATGSMKSRRYDLVLAFYPHARGFSYVVFEGPLSPVDWGMSDVPAKVKTRRCLRRLSLLLDRYQAGCAAHTRGIAEVHEGADREVACGNRGSRREVEKSSSSRSRARKYARHSHVLARRAGTRSQKRSPSIFRCWHHTPRQSGRFWNGEDRRMGLFDAMALALAFFEERNDYAERGARHIVARHDIGSIETLRAPVGPGALCPSIEVCRLRCAWTLSDPGFYFIREPGDSASSKPYPRGE